MTATDLRGKDTKSLSTMLDTKRGELAEAIRQKRVSEASDKTAIRKLRRDIALILTVMNEDDKKEQA